MHETVQLVARGHSKRLALFRPLVRHRSSAIQAGGLAERLGLKIETACTFLSSLRNANLILQNRGEKAPHDRASLAGAQALALFPFTDYWQQRLTLMVSPDDQSRSPQADAASQKLAPLFASSESTARPLCDDAVAENIDGLPEHPLLWYWSLLAPHAATAPLYVRRQAIESAYNVLKMMIKPPINADLQTLLRTSLQTHLNTIGLLQRQGNSA